MRLWALPLQLLGILVLAALASGGWLFRREIVQAVRPEVERMRHSFGAQSSGPGPDALARAKDKVDSLHGWHADSVLLSADEMAALVVSGLPRTAAAHLDSLSVMLGDGRVTISARLETAQIPKDVLGPLAGALNPWERVSAGGPLTATAPGRAEWRVDALTLRGFTLPEESSRRLIERALPGAKGGIMPLTLPEGIVSLRVRSTGVSLYRKESR
jgi:hypothetical protein